MLREVVSNEWFTILCVFCLLILAFTRYAFSNRFSEFLMVLGNSRYLKVYSKEQKFIDLFDTLLFINLIVSVSIFATIAYNTFFEPQPFDLAFFGKIAFSVCVIILSKILLERLIGSIFDIDQLIDSYLFQKTNYKNYLGLILLPVNILLIYVVFPSKTLIFIIIAALFLINLTGFFTTIKTYQKPILDNLFYFILYLCALEIGPYIILYKLLT